MNLDPRVIKPWLPSLPELSRETLAVLGGTILAAFVISRFPKVREWVNSNSFGTNTSGENIRT